MSVAFLDAAYFVLFIQLVAVVVIMKEVLGYPILAQEAGDAVSHE